MFIFCIVEVWLIQFQQKHISWLYTKIFCNFLWHLFFCLFVFIVDGSPESRLNVKFVQDTSKYWYKPDISREQGKMLEDFSLIWPLENYCNHACRLLSTLCWIKYMCCVWQLFHQKNSPWWTWNICISLARSIKQYVDLAILSLTVWSVCNRA